MLNKVCVVQQIGLLRGWGPKRLLGSQTDLRSGNPIYGAAAANNVSKLLRGNIVTGIVTTLVISSADFARLFRGRVSGAQVFKNVATTASAVAGGTGGWMGWDSSRGGCRVCFPCCRYCRWRGIVGGIIVSFAGGTAASKVAKTTLDKFIEDDAKKNVDYSREGFWRTRVRLFAQ